MDADAAAAGERAARLLPGLGFPAGAVAGEPIPVEPDGVPGREADAGSGRWFVPVVRGDDLLGFLDFAGTTLLRSSFFRPAGPARDWLDRDHIRQVAERFSGQDATGTPVLSHDGPADHLAWRVPMPSGTVFVAGTSAWWARPRPDDVTG